jgi:predicted permease
MADDYRASAAPVALISYRIWKTAFGGEPGVLGRTVERDGSAHTIVGVLPRSFVFPVAMRRIAPDVLVPAMPSASAAIDRSARGWFLLGRLADGVSRTDAQTELDAIALRLKPLYTGRPNLHPGAFDGATVLDLREQLTRTSRPPLRMVFVAAMAVFAVVCVNLVGLLLAHGEDRRRELAIRTSLGAGRGTLIRQLLIESAVLACAGGAVGWALTAAGFAAVVRRVPAWLQLLGEPHLDLRTAGFAAVLTVLTVLLAGVLPALRASAAAPRAHLAAGSGHSRAARGSRHVLIGVEVALAMTLLSAGTLLLRSWITLYSQDTGMDADRVVAVRAVPDGPLTDPARIAAFNARLAGAVGRIPGVVSVDLVDMPLLQRAVRGSEFVPPAIVRHPAGMDTDVTVTPGYFKTMGIRVLKGRDLRADDRGRAVVISEALADRYWPNRDPVGEFIRYGDGTREIAGVVSSTRDVKLDGAPMPTLYHVWDDAAPSIATVVARTSGPASRATAAVRNAVREADARAAVTMLATVDELLSTSVAERNFNTMLFTVFAGAGLLVALVGIYGLVAFVVSRREREMGIRLALGATGRGLQTFVMSRTLVWVAAGVATGIFGSLRLSSLLEPFVYGVTADDPATLGVAAAAFLATAALAAYLPARRAARVDPMIALRSE